MIEVMFRGAPPFGLTLRSLRRALESTFVVARRRSSGSVSVVFGSEAEMRRLNRRWRQQARSTDVLSFAPAAKMPEPRGCVLSWGDIILAPVFIRRECRQHSRPCSEQLLRVLIHGMLHLLAFDHATILEAKQMFKLQERALHRTLIQRL